MLAAVRLPLEAPARSAAGPREFFSAPPLVAVAVLALNDHVLKARVPGLLTGKLSDLAGCFLLPLFASALLAYATRWPLRLRLGFGAGATALLFGAVKTSAAAAGVVAGALSAAGAPIGLPRSAIVADASDLVALPLVAVAVLWGRHAGREDRPCGGS
jgi:hypothetical protein